MVTNSYALSLDFSSEKPCIPQQNPLKFSLITQTTSDAGHWACEVGAPSAAGAHRVSHRSAQCQHSLPGGNGRSRGVPPLQTPGSDAHLWNSFLADRPPVGVLTVSLGSVCQSGSQNTGKRCTYVYCFIVKEVLKNTMNR